jgi:cob(I)alamin adenosyltransferase
MKLSKGLVQLYTGNGKGKTTAAIGQAIRAYGHNLKICIFQFLKPEDSFTGELSVFKKLNIKVIRHKEPYSFKLPTKKSELDKFKNSLLKMLNQAKEAFNEYDIIILDEINILPHLKIIDTKVILDLIEQKPEKVELILTGRNAPIELINKADLVTQMESIKHPYVEKGLTARKGIEY